jgi:hypothetical protein
MIGRRIGALAGCLFAVVVLSGCTSARSDLGTSDSACFLAIPTAAQAVGPHSRLLGVRLLTTGSLRQQAPSLSVDLPSGSSRDRVCVLAFAGAFTVTSVAKPVGLPSGPVAVVVTRSPSNQLIATVIVAHPPLRFGHSHFG